QRLWHVDAAVGLLVVLQEGHEPAGGRAGPVEGRHGAVVVLGTLADPEPARLERRTVRRGRQLQPPLLARQPRLAVELAGCRAAEVSGGHVDDAIRELERGQRLLLEREQSLVLSLGLLERRVD